MCLKLCNQILVLPVISRGRTNTAMIIPKNKYSVSYAVSVKKTLE